MPLQQSSTNLAHALKHIVTSFESIDLTITFLSIADACQHLSEHTSARHQLPRLRCFELFAKKLPNVYRIQVNGSETAVDVPGNVDVPCMMKIMFAEPSTLHRVITRVAIGNCKM